jgi:hypothetical protein
MLDGSSHLLVSRHWPDSSQKRYFSLTRYETNIIQMSALPFSRCVPRVCPPPSISPPAGHELPLLHLYWWEYRGISYHDMCMFYFIF